MHTRIGRSIDLINSDNKPGSNFRGQIGVQARLSSTLPVVVISLLMVLSLRS